MAYDAFMMSFCLAEARRELVGGRIEKIHQPSRDTVVLQIKGQQRQKLLICASPASPRMHLTSANPENPAQPPMFCMLLRKHLSGAKLAKIRQLPLERVAELTFDCFSELGDPVQKKLTVELMGKTCNLYLLDEDGRIIDCLRRIGVDEHIKRPALPGLYYQSPEQTEKCDPAKVSLEELKTFLSQPGADLLSDRLMDVFGGLSPLVCREAALYSTGAADGRVSQMDEGQISKLWAFLDRWCNNPEPWCYTDAQGRPRQYAFCPVLQYGESEKKASFQELLDGFYTLKDQTDAMRQKGQAVRKTVTAALNRLKKKMALQEQELLQTLDRERLRQLGDILTANLHRIQKGQRFVEAEDFYDENMSLIRIPLSETLSPQQNAAKYYKDYARMKTAEKELTRQLELGRQEYSYLGSVAEELDRARTDADLEEIKKELAEQGYLKADAGKKKMKAAKTAPMRFESTDGFPIYVGRNNHQNEELTFKAARKDDLWLHAQKVHGSHVIISCGGVQPPDDTVTQAAQLAAYYSESTGGQNVPVDVTPVRQVKKPANYKPGMVIYHTYKTVVVNPYPQIVVDPLNAQNKDQ